MRRRWWRNDIVERTHACRERRASSTSCCLRVRVALEGICPREESIHGFKGLISRRLGKTKRQNQFTFFPRDNQTKFKAPIHHKKRHILSGVNTGRVPGGASPTSRRPRACRCRARPPRWRVHPAPCASARRQAPSSPRRKNAPRHRSCRSAPACWKRRNRRLQPGLSAAPQPATGP